MINFVAGNNFGLFNTFISQSLDQNITNNSSGNRHDQISVNSVNGNLVLQNVDHQLMGMGSSSFIARTYNSQGRFNDSNGDNFRFNFNQRLIHHGSYMTRISGDGHEATYNFVKRENHNDYYVSVDGHGAHDTLMKKHHNYWVWTDGDTGIAEVYDNSGRIKSKTDARGFSTFYEWDRNRISRIYDSSGQVQELHYNRFKNNQINRVVTHSQNGTQTAIYYNYDYHGRLTAVITDLTPEDNNIDDNNDGRVDDYLNGERADNVKITRYDYYNHSNLIKSMKQSDGQETHFTYVYSYHDGAWKVKTVQQGSGQEKQVMRFDYDSHNKRTDVTLVQDSGYLPSHDTYLKTPDGYGTGLTQSLFYDNRGRVVSTLSAADVDGMRAKISFRYDNDDNLVGKTDENGHTTIYQYDTHGNRVVEQDFAGNRVERVYNFDNLLVKESRFTVADDDGLGLNQASDARVTQFVYNHARQLRFVIEADGSVTEKRYQQALNLSDDQTIEDYIDRHVIPDIIYRNYHDREVAQPGYQVATFHYNVPLSESELATGVTENDLATWSNTQSNAKKQRQDEWFDLRDQLQQVVGYSDVKSNGEGAGEASVTRYHYNLRGNLLSKTQFQSVVDWDNEVVRETILNGGVPDEADVATTYFHYDGADRLTSSVDAKGEISTVQYGGSNVSARGHIISAASNGLLTTSIYDRRGYQVAVVESDANDVLNQTLSQVSYFYDTAGRLRLTLDPTGIASHSLYDNLGRVVGTIDGSGTLMEHVFDSEGLVKQQIVYAKQLSKEQMNALVKRNFDGEIVGVAEFEQSDPLDGLRENDSENRVVHYFYDKADRLLFSVDEVGAITGYEYNGNSELVKQTAFSEFSGVEAVKQLMSPALSLSDAVANQVTIDDSLSVDQLLNGSLVTAWINEQSLNVSIRSEQSMSVQTDIQFSVVTDGFHVSRSQVVALDNGQFMVVWQACQQGSNYNVLHTQTFDANGQATSERKELNHTGYSRDYYDINNTVVTKLANGDIVIAAQVRDFRTTWFGNRSRHPAHSDDIAFYLLSQSEPAPTIREGYIIDRSEYGAEAEALQVESDADDELFSEEGSVIANSSSMEVEPRVIAEEDGGFSLQWRTTFFGHYNHTYSKHYFRDDSQVHYRAEKTIEVSAQDYYHNRTDFTHSNRDAVEHAIANLIDENDDISQIEVTKIDGKGALVTWLSEGNLLGMSFDRLGQIKEAVFVIAENVEQYQALSLNGNEAVIYFENDHGENFSLTLSRENIQMPEDNSVRDNRMIYDEMGRVIASIDADNFLIENRYNALGQLQQSIAYANPVLELGSEMSHENIEQWRPAEVTHADRRHFYFYDNRGLMVAEVDAEQYINTYAYDASDNEVESKRFYEKVPGNGSVDVITALDVSPWLAESNRELFKSVKTEYNAFEQVVAKTDEHGLRTEYVYNVVGQLISTKSYDSEVSEADRVERQSVMTYDVQGRLTTQQNALSLALGESKTFQYDDSGRLTSSTDYNGHIQMYLYDASSRVTHVISAKGEVTESEYNSFGELVALKQYDQRLAQTDLDSISGGLIDESTADIIRLLEDEHTSISRSDYDRRGLLTTTTDEEGYISDYHYNIFSELTGASHEINKGDDERSWTIYERNNRGLIEKQTQFVDPFVFEPLVFDPLTFDPANAELSSVASESILNTYRYDAFGSLIETIDGNHLSHESVVDRLGRTIETTLNDRTLGKTTYDAFNQVTSLFDGRNFETTFVYDKLNSSYVLTTPEGISVHYTQNAFGETVSVTDDNNNKTEYLYDVNGNQTAIVKEGVTLSRAEFNSANLTVQSFDANNTKVQFEYDHMNRMVHQILDPKVDSMTGEVNESGLNLSTRIVFDAKGKVIEVIDQSGTTTQNTYNNRGELIQTLLDPNGLRLAKQYTLDGLGHRVNIKSGQLKDDNISLEVSSHKTQKFDALGRLTSVKTHMTDQDDLVVKFVLDANGNVIESIDANSHSSYYVYDSEDRLAYSVDTLGATTYFRYDSASQVIETRRYSQPVNIASLLSDGVLNFSEMNSAVVDLSSDTVERKVFDQDGRLSFSVNAVGAVTGFEYDGNNNQVKTTKYSNTIAAGVDPQTVVSDPSHDHVTQTVYDALNRVVFTVDGTGAVTQYHYDSGGNVIQTTAYANRIGVNATVTSLIPDPIHDQVTRMSYDTANRVEYSVDALGSVTHFEYDKSGNVIQQTQYATQINPLEHPRSVAHDAIHDRVTRYEFDEANRMTYSVDALGGVLKYEYDSNGNVVKTIAFSQPISPQQSATDVTLNAEHDRVTQSVYDSANRLVFVIDAMGGVIENQYDSQGNRVKSITYSERLSDGESLDALQLNAAYDQVLRAEYDATNRMLYSIDGEGAVVGFRYDSLGNMISKTSYANAIESSENSSHLVTDHSKDQTVYAVFNQANQMIYSIDAERAVIQFEYDAFGKTLKQTAYAKTLSIGADIHSAQLSSPADRITQFEYDQAGRQTKTIYPTVGVYQTESESALLLNGKNSTALRNESQTSLFTEAFYDAFGNITANRDASGHMRYQSYDANGRITFSVDAEGYATGYQRDTFGNALQMTRYSNPISQSERQSWQANLLTTDTVEAQLQTVEDNRTMTMAYDKHNNIVQITQPKVFVFDGSSGKESHAVTQHVYDRFSQLIQSRVQTSSGGWLESFEYYDKRGAKVASIDKMGYLSTYKMDAFSNLIESIEYSKAASGISIGGYTLPSMTQTEQTEIGRDRVMTFDYDKNNRKVSDTRVNVNHSVSTNGTNVIRDLTNRYRYDSFGNVIEVIDAKNASTQTFFDKENRILSVIGSQRSVDGNNEFRALTEFNRDAFGNVVTQSEFAKGALNVSDSGYSKVLDSNHDRHTKVEYDSWGRSVKVTDAVNNVTFYSYHANGKIAKQWSAVTGNNNVTETAFSVYQYDKLGRIIRLVSPASQSNDVVTTVIGYNGFGEMISRGIAGIDNGASETLEYDNAGRLWRSNSSGVTKVMLYDQLGRMSSEIRHASIRLTDFVDAETVHNLADRRTNNTYDANGRLIQQRLANGATVYQTFDRWGNRLSFSDPRNASWVTRFTFNQNNQKTSEIKPEVEVITRPSGDTINKVKVNPTTRFYFDAAGNQVAVRDARNFIQSTRYDSAGNVLEEHHADGGMVKHEYNGFGEEVALTDAMDNKTVYVRNQLGLVTQIRKPKVSHTLFTTTADHTRLKINDFTPTVDIRYDSLGRKLSETHNDANNSSIRYTYDLRGNVIKLDNYGRISTSEYDKRDRKVKETDANFKSIHWEYDYFGLLVGKTDLGGAVYQFTYNSEGQLEKESNSNGRVVDYQYDSAGQVKSIVDVVAGSVKRKTEFSYDLGGRHLTEKTTVNGIVFQNESLKYDSIGRLVQVNTKDNTTLNYQYDAANNRTHLNENIGGTYRNSYFSFDSMNRQVLVDGLTNNNVHDSSNYTSTQGMKIEYDKNGNRLTERSGENASVTIRYTYDDLNRLTKVENWNAGAGHYELKNERDYDKRGRVVYLTGAFKNLEYDANNNLIRQELFKEDAPNTVDATIANSYDLEGNLVSSFRQNAGSISITNQYAYEEIGDSYKQKTITAVRSDNTGNPGLTTFGYDVNGYLSSLTDEDNASNNRTFINDNNGVILQKLPNAGDNGKVHNVVVNGRVLGSYGRDLDPNSPNKNVDYPTQVGDSLATIVQAQQTPRTWNEIYNEHKSLVTTQEIKDEDGNVTGYLTLEELDRTERANAVLKDGQVITLKDMPAFSGIRDFVDYQKVDQAHPGSTLGQHVIRPNETLRSIAQGAYGDAQLWYLIANANGITSDADLRTGQVLTLPNVVNGEHNNSTTFQPYDPSVVIGDTNPYVAPPPADDGNSCGKIAIIIVAVIAAVAITVLSAGVGAAIVGPAAGAFVTVAAGAVAGGIGGAVGSAVSQGILIAGDVQKGGFSWTDVGIGALTGFVGGGLLGGASAIGTAAKAGSLGVRAADMAAKAANAGRVGRAAILAGKAAGYAAVEVTNDAISQGIKIQAGEQTQFNWSQVAAAAVMGALGGAAGSIGKEGSFTALGAGVVGDLSGAALGNTITNNGGFDPTQFVADAAGSLAGGVLSHKAAQLGRRLSSDAVETRSRSNATVDAPHKRRINAVVSIGPNVDGAALNLSRKSGHIGISPSQIGEVSGPDTRLVIAGHGGINKSGEFTVGGKTAKQMAIDISGSGATEFSKISLAACNAGDSDFPNRLYAELAERQVSVGGITARNSEVRVGTDGRKFIAGGDGTQIHNGAKVLVTSANAAENQIIRRSGQVASEGELVGLSQALMVRKVPGSSPVTFYSTVEKKLSPGAYTEYPTRSMALAAEKFLNSTIKSKYTAKPRAKKFSKSYAGAQKSSSSGVKKDPNVNYPERAKAVLEMLHGLPGTSVLQSYKRGQPASTHKAALIAAVSAKPASMRTSQDSSMIAKPKQNMVKANISINHKLADSSVAAIVANISFNVRNTYGGTMSGYQKTAFKNWGAALSSSAEADSALKILESSFKKASPDAEVNGVIEILRNGIKNLRFGDAEVNTQILNGFDPNLKADGTRTPDTVSIDFTTNALKSSGLVDAAVVLAALQQSSLKASGAALSSSRLS